MSQITVCALTAKHRLRQKNISVAKVCDSVLSLFVTHNYNDCFANM